MPDAAVHLKRECAREPLAPREHFVTRAASQREQLEQRSAARKKHSPTAPVALRRRWVPPCTSCASECAGQENRHLNDPLSLPYTEAAMQTVRADVVQDKGTGGSVLPENGERLQSPSISTNHRAGAHACTLGPPADSARNFVVDRRARCISRELIAAGRRCSIGRMAVRDPCLAAMDAGGSRVV